MLTRAGKLRREEAAQKFAVGRSRLEEDDDGLVDGDDESEDNDDEKDEDYRPDEDEGAMSD